MWKVTWNNWKLGFAFYRGTYVSDKSICDGACKEPSQYYIYLGPFEYFACTSKFMTKVDCQCNYFF